MIVTSEASSHHNASPGYPSDTARLKTNATVIAREIRVIIPGLLSRSSCNPPLTNTNPP